MRTIVINGDTWGVVRVPAGDPRLFDMTGTERLGTTDPRNRTVSIRSDLGPPMLDRVVVHEIAHAIAVSWGLVGGPTGDPDEWTARMIENHAIEAVSLAALVLGRPPCVRGECA
jgi:hypothetical protein